LLAKNEQKSSLNCNENFTVSILFCFISIRLYYFPGYILLPAIQDACLNGQFAKLSPDCFNQENRKIQQALRSDQTENRKCSATWFDSDEVGIIVFTIKRWQKSL